MSTPVKELGKAWWTQVYNRVICAVVFLDDHSAECLHWECRGSCFEELSAISGALMVMSYPHFLFADFVYRNGVLGITPNIQKHRLFVDLEPNTGTVVRGMKRAQFNIFMRRVEGISETNSLRPTLMPLLWIEEGMELPDDYVDMLMSRLLGPLQLKDILIPVGITLACLVLLVGLGMFIYGRYTVKKAPVPVPRKIRKNKWHRRNRR